MPQIASAALTAIAAYLLGSIPFAVLSSRLFGLADPRTYGSGNPGATNVLRSGNKKAAILTLIGDALKGVIAVLAARALTHDENLVAIAGIAAFVGHVFSVFLRFRGGKGVATAGGVLLAMHWPVGVATLACWIFIAATTRYSSAAALVSALASPFLTAWLFPQASWVVAVAVMALILIWRHWANIGRLFSGQESKLGKKKA
ncbi:glycerol-3-phosphate 1-O-acyltransferase PlsY [Niveibacterium sp. SC-1]|uniref:glycerol-3-phosphate 1-O-acyltransferase PlsY n=1 Tax=Niveibacterium sp. SC-1 TaxID=3135646 RepID=UPI00311FB9C2